MPFVKPSNKISCVVLIAVFVMTGMPHRIYGNGLSTPAPETPRRVQKNDSLATLEIIKLVQMEIASQNRTLKIKEEDYVDQAYTLAKKTGNLGFLSTQLNYAGNKERISGHFPIALSLYSRGLMIAERLKDTNLITHFYNNIGVVYRKIDDYQNALRFTIKALRLNTLTRDSLGMAISLNSLGNAQLQLGEYDEAMMSFRESLKLEQNRKNKIGLAINLNNIGNVYHLQKNYKQAISYYKLSLEINQRINSKKGMAICYNDLSEIYRDLGDIETSKEYSEKAIAISEGIDFHSEEANAYLDLGEIYFLQKQNKKAIQNLNKGIDLMKPLGGKAFLEQSYKTLYKIYLKEKDYKEAMKYLRMAQNYHDSLLSLDVRNNIARLQIQYQTEQKENQITLLNQKARLAQLSVKKQRYLIFFLLSAFLLMLIVLFFTVISLRRKKDNNRILTLKNREIGEARQALENNEKELIKARDEAEKNALAKSQIMADISHEIRTPLNSVIGFSDLLYKSAADDQQKKYLEAIGASGRSLLNLINEILDSSKQGKEDQPLELADFNLKECVQEVCNIFTLKAEEKNIALKTRFAEDLPAVIHFSKMLLQQILLNLVGNAVKFTFHGSVEIIVTGTANTEKDLLRLILEIKDTGVGIPLEEQDQVFKPFHRVQSGAGQEGSGLGLSITENLVKRMNGTINLISQKGKGSRFIVTFDDIRVVPEITSPDLIDTLMANIQKPTFLLLSQKEDVKQDVNRLFEECGFQLLDVGVNMAEARKHFQHSLLTILCCLNPDELRNTLSVLEKENLKEDHRILIIANDAAPFIATNSKSVTSIPAHREILPEKLKAFIRSYQEEILEHILFETATELSENTNMVRDFSGIFRHEYKEASATHLLDSIRNLADKLNNTAAKYGLKNMTAFCETLIQSINQFDTNAIEKQLSILEKAFKYSFDFK